MNNQAPKNESLIVARSVLETESLAIGGTADSLDENLAKTIQRVGSRRAAK